MTKREAIREGMARQLVTITKRMSPLKAATFTAYKVQADAILSYLHSQGVVIKVERDLPTFSPPFHIKGTAIETMAYEWFCKTQQDMHKWHSDCLEPLIER